MVREMYTYISRNRKLFMEAARAKRREHGGRKVLNEEGGSNVPCLDRNEFRSRGLRKEVEDIYSGPVYREGVFVMILKDTRPGINPSLSMIEKVESQQ